MKSSSTTKFKQTEVGQIPEEWDLCELQDVVKSIIDYRGKTPTKTTHGVPLVTAKIVKQGRIDFSNLEYIAESDYDTWMRRGLPEAGEVVITTEAPLGEVAQLPNIKIALAQRIITVSGKDDILNNTFLKYYFLSSIGQSQLKSKESGSVVTGIKQSELRKVKVLLPPMYSQEWIVGILSSLDQKIELNRKMNKTLEEMGQALFRHYFIDNPDAKEWQIKKFGEVVKVVGGGTPSTTDPSLWNGGIAWTSPRDLTGHDEVFLLNTDKTISESGLRKISSGLLPKHTLLLSSRAPIGYLAISIREVAINQGYIAFLPEGYLSNNFMFFWLKRNMDLIKNAANGSTFMEISKTVFKSLETKIPPKQVLEEFEKQTEILFSTIRNLQLQNQNLIQSRDALLPRLMSGKISL